MAEVKNKPYILDQWRAAGLIDEADINQATKLQTVRYNIAKLTKGLNFAKDKDEIRALERTKGRSNRNKREPQKGMENRVL